MSPEQELDLRMAEPEEGSLLQMKLSYPETPKSYVYAVIGFDGYWYLSGISSVKQRTWNGLIDSFKKKGIEVIYIKKATSLEDIL